MADRYTVWCDRGVWIVVDTRDCGTVARFSEERDAMAERLRLEETAQTWTAIERGDLHTVAGLTMGRGVCRYCGAARPDGYSVTCGRSECQEAAYHDKEKRKGA